MEPILVVGAGGHAVSCIDVLEQQGLYDVVGLIGLTEQIGQQVLGYPILGDDDALPELVKRYDNVLLAIGQIKTAERRRHFFDFLLNQGCQLPNIISPYAYVSRHASLSQGCIVMHGAKINAGVQIGNNCIINSQALVEHGVKIDEHCHISTASVVNGDVVIGAGTFIGSRSCIREGLTIGPNVVIGMGQIVRKNCTEGTRYILSDVSE